MRYSIRKLSKSSFTLIELLVVIGVLASLISLLSPSLNSALEKGRDLSCRKNISILFAAIDLYTEDHNQFYPAAGSADDPLSIDSKHLDYNLSNPDVNVSWDDRLSAYDGRELLNKDQMAQSFLHSEGQPKAGDGQHAWTEPNANSSLYICPNDPYDRNVDWFDHPLLGRSYAINGIHKNGVIKGVTNNNRSIMTNDVEDFPGTILLGPFPNQSGFLGRASNHTLLSASRTHHPTSKQGLWQKFQMTGLHDDLNNYLLLDGHVEQLHFTWTTDPDKVDSFGNSGGMWSTQAGD